MAVSHTLFTNPARNACVVLQHLFQIFFAQWKTFLAISCVMILSMIGVSFLLSIVLAIFLMGTLSGNMQDAQETLMHWNGAGGSRFLLLSSSRGVSRLLEDYYANEAEEEYGYNEAVEDNEGVEEYGYNEGVEEYGYNEGVEEYGYNEGGNKNMDFNGDGMYYGYDVAGFLEHYGINDMSELIKIGFELMAIFFIMALIYSMVIAIFKAAFLRTAAVTYAGYDPTTSESLRIGRSKSLTLFGYNFILGLINLIASLLIVMLPAMLSNNDVRVIVPCTVVLVIFDVLLNSVMIAGGPAIVVEDKGVFGAFKRSWQLCRSSTCFIFSTAVCFVCVEILISVALEIGAAHLQGHAFTVYSLFAAIVGVAMTSLGSIMIVVLYMSCRIQTESCSQKELIANLKLSDMSKPLVEMEGEKKLPAMNAQVV